MPRKLESSDLLITKIDGRNYAYIKPEIGGFSPTQTVDGVSVSGNSGASAGSLLARSGDVYFENVSAANMKTGLQVERSADVRVFDYKFSNAEPASFAPGFAAAIKRSDDHSGSAEFLRVFADGKDVPKSGAKFDPSRNTDFFDNNNSKDAVGGAVFFRDVTAKNFADAAFDAKSDVYIMNATIENTITGLRTWTNGNIIIVNSEISSVAGAHLVKLTGDKGKVYYYNTTWNGKSKPDLDEITTWKVPQSDWNKVKSSNVIELKSNPLPKIDSFFTVDDSKYFLEVSVNGGAWRKVDVPNGGYLSSHVGDTLIRLPDLGSGTYRLRAWTVEDGKTSPTAVSNDFKVAGSVVELSSGALKAKPAAVEQDTIVFTPAAKSEPAADVSGEVVSGAVKNARGGYDLFGGNGDEVFLTSAGDDRISTGHGNDAIVFDNRKDIGDDVVVGFNRGRDKLYFTEFVDLGADTVHKLDGKGRFVLDDRALDANGGTIALGESLAGRFVHYAGETEDGLFVYEIWNRPWGDIPG